MTDIDVLPLSETKTVSISQGREIAYIDYGEPSAPLIIHNHGGPSSRIEARVLAAAAVRQGLRMVAVDRPGYGRTPMQESWNYQMWSADLAEVASILGYEQFGVSGWSGGGPAALAAAAYIDPSRLLHVTDIAGAPYGAFGADWASQYLSAADKLGGRLAIHHPLLMHWMYSSIELDAVHFRNSYWKTLYKVTNDHDRAYLDAPGVQEAFVDASADCFAQGVEGLLYDSELCYKPWPFDVTKIERTIHIWQGTDDHFVPFEINKIMAERIPGAVLHEVPGGDHFIAIGCADEIFAVAASEIHG